MRSERDRGEIFEALCRGIGVPAAEFVMQLFDTVDRLLLAQERDTAALRGEMAEVRGEMAEVRGEMHALAAELRGEMRALSAELRGEMAELRGEMRAMLPRFVMTTLAMMIALVAAVITAGQLL